MQTSEISNLIVAKIQANFERVQCEWANPNQTQTRHFKIDGLLPENIAKDVYNHFPKEPNLWFKRKTFREQKKTFAKLEKVNALIENVTDAFHQPAVVDIISKITKIANLEPDPKLYAGGISMMELGDFLNPHIDNSHDKDRERYRRLNLLYYVTPNWDPKNGGNLELWDNGVKTPQQIDALFNRLVVMETNRDSWHSVNPVTSSERRCCVSNYYFSPSSPEPVNYYHVTSFLGRPNQPIQRAYGRLDNALRQLVSQTLKISRGRNLGRSN